MTAICKIKPIFSLLKSIVCLHFYKILENSEEEKHLKKLSHMEYKEFLLN